MSYKNELTKIIRNMTLEKKIAQLFIITPEAVAKSDETFLDFDAKLEKALIDVPIGGILYFGRNLSDSEQISNLLKESQSFCCANWGIPLFQCIDEEGGRVSKVLNSGIISTKVTGTPFDWGKKKDKDQVRIIGSQIGLYLSSLGFNVDFAPCVDILTNPLNKVIGNRSFGSDPQTVADMSMEFAKGLLSMNVLPSFKHFPGHGDTDTDSHLGYACSNKTLDELFDCELIPFESGINNNIPLIMVGHISLPHVTKNNEPASLSKEIVTDLLRNHMGYDGIIITDSLKMRAISDNYSSKDAAVKAIEAGADIILRPLDFYEAYYGVIDAVEKGLISESRIDESLGRILKTKEAL